MLARKIIDTANLLINYLIGKQVFDVTDALSAYWVLNKKEANNIFEKAMISSSPIRKFSFEPLLENWTVKYDGEEFLPYINLKNGLEIEKIDITHLKKHLYSFNFPCRIFSQIKLLNPKDIKDYKQFKLLTKKVFQIIDTNISKEDIDVMFNSIYPGCPWVYSNNEKVIVQQKINNLIVESYNNINCKVKANQLICAFIFKLKEIKSINAKSLTDALNDYFIPKVQLSEGTFNYYIYNKTNAGLNYEDYQNILDPIIPIPISHKKRSKK